MIKKFRLWLMKLGLWYMKYRIKRGRKIIRCIASGDIKKGQMVSRIGVSENGIPIIKRTEIIES